MLLYLYINKNNNKRKLTVNFSIFVKQFINILKLLKMRNLLLTIVFAIMSVFMVSATTIKTTPVIKHYYSTELNDSINKIHVSVPCRIICYDNDSNVDSPNIVITDRSELYNVYYTVKDGTIYIKSNLGIDDLHNLEYRDKVKTPIIRIMTKTNKTPEIVTGSGYNLSNNSNNGKATKSTNN